MLARLLGSLSGEPRRWFGRWFSRLLVRLRIVDRPAEPDEHDAERGAKDDDAESVHAVRDCAVGFVDRVTDGVETVREGTVPPVLSWLTRGDTTGRGRTKLSAPGSHAGAPPASVSSTRPRPFGRPTRVRRVVHFAVFRRDVVDTVGVAGDVHGGGAGFTTVCSTDDAGPTGSLPRSRTVWAVESPPLSLSRENVAPTRRDRSRILGRASRFSKDIFDSIPSCQLESVIPNEPRASGGSAAERAVRANATPRREPVDR
jgi:hypothetical protein